MALKLHPGHVLVREILPSLTTKSGIILSIKAEKLVKRCRRGKVLVTAVDLKNNILEKGDIILFGKFNGENIFIDEPLIMLKHSEVLAKVNPVIESSL